MSIQGHSSIPPLLGALVCWFVSACCWLWAMSSFSLAYAVCDGTFSLTSENFRCQRPVILAILFWAFAVFGLILLALAGYRTYVKHRGEHRPGTGA
ncbi:hypothetical protein MTYM_02320 [Methylococcales bacterium]|nr:hypothetical protein MTYM_02320 [Methylococcales bacterium]